MNAHLISLFVVVPMLTGILCLLLGNWRMMQRTVGLIGLLVNFSLAVWAVLEVYESADLPTRVLVSQMGNWPAPFGITIAVDGLSAIMLAVSSGVCLCVYIYCTSQLQEEKDRWLFHPLFHLLMFGVQWSFITGDLFNLFVAFEIMLMASYAMFVISGSKAMIRQSYKYVLMNLLASTMFVTCAGLLYGHLGTLNMADITRIAISGQLPARSIPIIALLLVVFGSKTAIFPLWFWLPDTYHTMPAAIGGLFAGLLTKVGAYVMIRVFVMMFGSAVWFETGTQTPTAYPVADTLQTILLVSAIVTMFVGVLGAVSMHSVRRILSIHIISQVGYMLFGIALGMGVVFPSDGALSMDLKMLAVMGAIFFVIHNMVVKCCLFLCSGLIEAHAGSDDLDKIGGLLKRAPWLGALFMIAAMSLAGLPPLSGFFGKWVLISAGLQRQETLVYIAVGFAVATSVFTLLSMLKIWSYGFWSPASGKHVDQPQRTPRVAGGMFAIALLVVAALSMGLTAQPFLNICESAARTVVNPRAYVAAVLGEDALADAPDIYKDDGPSRVTLNNNATMEARH
jgi:multicomponent Na+:H+ antiporter subunit D